MRSVSVPGYDALNFDFQDTYDQIRTRDANIVSFTKLYVVLILLAGITSLTLLQLQGNTQSLWLVGVTLVGASVVGFLMLHWLIAFRRSFVEAAQQLRTLRSAEQSEDAGADEKDAPDHRLDSMAPSYWNPASTHLTAILMASIGNAGFAGLGAATLAHEELLKGIPPGGAFAVFACAACSLCLIWAVLSLWED